MKYHDYQSDYLRENATWHVEDSNWKAMQIEKILHRNNLDLKRIVEIGCGAGEILNQLKERLPSKELHFEGYDISPDAIELASTRNDQRITFFKEDLLNKDEFYDLLLMIDVFEHVENPFDFIRRCSKKADYKIFHIPLDISVFFVLSNRLMYLRSTVGHINYYTKETALATLEDCGLKIVDSFYTKGAIERNNVLFKQKVINSIRSLFFFINKDLAARLFGGFSLMVLAK